ncbi:glycoside hydrolase family 10 protein [Massilia sp. DWR3-1-1]|uniref:glycoside hydrolase family 10 protein n=1 Tax=Massilia sp. DWR3-1-1 TaxID=2804559 RepID=UPI003CEB41A6
MQLNLHRRALALALWAACAMLASCSTTVKPPLSSAPVPGASLPGASPPGVLRPPVAPGTALLAPPSAPREFRAVWVSTVANIDWPSKSNLNAAEQQREAIAILDRARAMNLNAIVLQVRPSADAIYPSAIEPWSEYLTGVQGTPPKPLYDPLAFWVAQAHARGLQLHAWFNPYRARQTAARSPVAANHISRTNPGAVKSYGKYLWMDPGEPAASKQTLDVVLDVVRRYDIDGVHIDDYFYPYPIEPTGAAGETLALESTTGKNEVDFPDGPSWQKYLASGGKLERAAWRRQNVNALIERLYTGIHHEKSWVLFGISPFGLGKPALRPKGIVGFSQYDKLYADAELWLQNGWLDYLSPQLYWAIEQKGQAYDVLLDYWIGQNRQQRHIWPGLFTSRIGAPTKDYPPAEIVQQIGVTRSRPGAGGHVHFSMAPLMDNRKGISEQLKAGHYAGPALVPASPWLGAGLPTLPGAPQVRARREGAGVSLKLAPASGTTAYAIWTRYGQQWRFAVVPAATDYLLLTDDPQLGAPGAVFVNAVDRLGRESAPVAVLGK